MSNIVSQGFDSFDNLCSYVPAKHKKQPIGGNNYG
tara:strand:- start:143 stop:247 length:105 start_codon:yes stop_codon:yes gene_type:complete